MINPFKRAAVVHRPTLQPAPGTRPYEVDAIEVSEGNDDDAWELWEDSVQEFESSAMLLDPFEGVRRRDL
jgi:hypothetical protein